MPSLFIVQGNRDINLDQAKGTSYVYKIGTPVITGGDYIDLNNSTKLDEKAEEIRDRYVDWIFRLNSLFVSRNLVYKNISAFFLTDLSCNRTEIFDTFSTVVNILVIQDALRGITVDEVKLCGVSSGFYDAIKSVFPASTISQIQPIKPEFRFLKVFVTDLRYYLELCVIGLINKLRKSRNNTACDDINRLFFSIYPSMLQPDFTDKKYGELVDKDDVYAVSVVTDGYHQHYGVVKYYTTRKALRSAKVSVIDDHIRICDGFIGASWLGKNMLQSRHIHREKKLFSGIDLTTSIGIEIIISLSRMARLIAYSRCFKRFINQHEIREFVYYLHEYPLGRMITWILGSENASIRRVGMQHGPSSWRKLLYFLPSNKVDRSPPWIDVVPVPDEIWAEDTESARIYRHSGYSNVSVLPRIFRLSYLDRIETKKDPNLCLIAPGLHDGRDLLLSLREKFQEERTKNFLLKPHPLANNRYLDDFTDYPNLSITEEPVNDLLSRVSAVYVTYSSVGIEASRLGLSVHVISIPGVVTQSPLQS